MKNFRFVSKLAAACLLTFVLLIFNWDRVEMENRAFVITIGIDTSGEDDARFEVSMNIVDTEAMERGSENTPVIKRKANGESLAMAMEQIGAKISETVYYGHTKAIVLGESLLNDEDMLRETVDTLSRKNEINIKAIVMSTDKSSEDVLEAKPSEHGLLGVYLSNFYNNNNANTASRLVKLDLERLISSLESDHSVVIPKISLEGEGEEQEIIIGGVAVVKDFCLAGYVDEEKMEGFLWMMENAAGASVSIDIERGHMTYLVEKSKVKISFYEKNGHLHCLVRLNTKGSIEGARFMGDSLFDAGKITELQQQFADEIYSQTEETINVFHDEFGVDGFGLKEILRKKEWKLYEKYAEDWEESFENMDVTIDVDVTIGNTGSIK